MYHENFSLIPNADITPSDLGHKINKLIPHNGRQEFSRNVLLWLLSDVKQYTSDDAALSVIEKVISLLEEQCQDVIAWNEACNDAWNVHTALPISASRAAAAVASSSASLDSEKSLCWAAYWAAMAASSAAQDTLATRLLEFVAEYPNE